MARPEKKKTLMGFGIDFNRINVFDNMALYPAGALDKGNVAGSHRRQFKITREV